MKPKLLVIELWGLGDLVIATPFLQAASRQYAVTLLAKPYASDMQPRFWPEARVVTFVAPWTAFRNKYRLTRWPWKNFAQIFRLRPERFEVGLSARWDPRDHLLLWLLGVRRRLGFPRVGSKLFLTDPLERAEPVAHRYESWRVVARELGLALPDHDRFRLARETGLGREVLVHTGAGQPVRVWPLDRYRTLVTRLRQQGHLVQVACDPEQRAWWQRAGELSVMAPKTVTELLGLIDRAGVFIGNDSGPAHLAGFSGVPTFTIFGPQLPEWFAPLHPGGEVFEGKPCPYKPCSDYCRFPIPVCLNEISEEELCARAGAFVNRHLPLGLVAESRL